MAELVVRSYSHRLAVEVHRSNPDHREAGRRAAEVDHSHSDRQEEEEGRRTVQEEDHHTAQEAGLHRRAAGDIAAADRRAVGRKAAAVRNILAA